MTVMTASVQGNPLVRHSINDDDGNDDDDDNTGDKKPLRSRLVVPGGVLNRADPPRLLLPLCLISDLTTGPFTCISFPKLSIPLLHFYLFS